MRKVILDTNFLMLPFQFGIDIFSEIERILDEPKELVVPSAVLVELRALARKKNRAAKLGLTLIEAKIASGAVKVEKSKGRADDWIAGNAPLLGAVVCTNDIGLKKRLLRKARLIVLRNRSKLEIV